MTTSLIIEDGSQVQGANSYINEADASAYLTTAYGANNAFTATGNAQNQQTIALYQACYAMEKLYGRRYLSVQILYSKQGLLFPRFLFMANDFRIYQNTMVPQPVKDAQCELALMYLKGCDLYPDESDNRLFKMYSIGGGALTRQYWKIPNDVARYDGFRKIDLILWPILETEDNRNATITL